MPELRTGVRGLNLELLQGIGRRLDAVAGSVQEVDGVRVVVNAIQDEVVLCFAFTVGVEVAISRTASAICGGNSGRELGKEDVVALIERDVVDLLLAHHLANAGLLGLQQGSRR